MPARNIVIGQNVSSAKVQRAKELRQNMTEAEKALWQAVRANRLNGWHFRRQQIIGGFIADFYCHAAALVVELDGGIHKSQQEYDQERTELIKTYGIEVVRFKNETVLTQLPQVLQEIDHLCRERSNSNTPSPQGKGPGDR
jgi:very-short-patch-repair endonuclease